MPLLIYLLNPFEQALRVKTAAAVRSGKSDIPSLLFFKDGKVEKQIVGAVEKTEISTILNELK